MKKHLLCLLFLTAAATQAQDDPLFRAMKDELDRSMRKLQLEKLDKPYFIAYKLVDTAAQSAAASFGALTEQNERRTRLVSVEVRVGDYARDNTNFFTMRLGPSGVVRRFAEGGIETPLDDNYDEIRRQLWLATDSAYKQALDDYTKKKAVLDNRSRTDDSADFSKEPKQDSSEDAAPARLNPAQASALVKELSAAFRQSAGIDNSTVRLSASTVTTRYLNTEGTRYRRVTPLVTWSVAADAQAADGMPLADSESVHARSAGELPKKEDLLARVKALQQRMVALRDAKTIERFTGPVLFEGQAAAELLAQTVIPAFVGLPRIVVDNPMFERAFGADEGGMRDKLGSRVFPTWLNITDDATLRDFAGKPLLGGYAVDEDGVLARANRIVERGVFKQLLNSRALVGGATQSTGNRRTAGAMASNVIVSASQTATPAELKTKLIALAKDRGVEYGVIVRRVASALAPRPQGRNRAMVITIGGPGGTGSQGYAIEPVVEAVKVYTDGREELVRNLQVTGMTLASFRDLVAAGDAPTVYTNTFRNNRQSPLLAGPMFANTPLVSIATPSLLFEELTLQRPIGEVPKLPFSKHPSFE